jgi:hypothetical protein
MSIQNIIDSHEMELKGAILSLPCVAADKLGLDIRAGGRLYIDEDERAIYVKQGDLRVLDYYGGFEYIDEGEGRSTLAGFVRFDGYESDRVAECFEALNDSEED